MASTEHPEPEAGDEPDEPADAGEANVAAAVNAYLDVEMGPEPTDDVETVDASVESDTGLAEWAERVKETQYGLG